MSIRLTLVGIVVTLLLSIGACGGSQPAPMGESPSPVAPAATVPAFTGGLPGLDNLPAAEHAISMTGPGWFDIPINNYFGASGVTFPHLIDTLPLTTPAGTAYAAYSVGGFDGDNGPTSARITAQYITGDYYVGFSDYAAGRWTFAGPFTDSATVEIPNENEYISPNAFTSTDGNCYLVIVVPEGGAITLSTIELGVHGGMLGPAAPYFTNINSDEDTIQFIWHHSNDAQDPDFAGYILERAPQLYGNFTPLTPQGYRDTVFMDESVAPGEIHRYRLTAVDVSGNRSLSATVSTGANPAGELRPVPRLNLPRGPFYGPVRFSIDMSESYDPEGELIDDYRIGFWGPAGSYDGPDPVKHITLQPGCYTFNASVHCGMRSGMITEHIKVYPRWKPEPVVINPSAHDKLRAYWIVSGIHPSTGNPVHLSVDRYTDQFMFRTEDGTGDLNTEFLHLSSLPLVVNDPVTANGQLIFLLQNSASYQLYRHDGYHPEFVFGTTKQEEVIPGFAGDGGNRTWLVTCQENAGIYSLVVQAATQLEPLATVVDGSGLIVLINALYNPAADAIDIVYTMDTTNKMYWVRYALDGAPVVPVEIVPGASSVFPKLQLDPATGRPGLVYLDSATVISYTELNEDLATWSPPDVLDDSLPNLVYYDLAYTNSGPAVLMGLNDGSVNVLEHDGGWTVRNTMSNGLTGACYGSLLNEPDSENLIATYRTNNFELVSVELEPGGVNTPRWSVPGVAPQGAELHATGGSDAVHVIIRNSDGMVDHFMSPDGTGWTPENGIALNCSNLDMVESGDGHVYLSYYNSGFNHLSYWDGVSWAAIQFCAASSTHRSLLSANSYSDEMRWGSYIESTGNFRFVDVEQGEAPTITDIPYSQPVWAGSVNGSGTTMMLIAGGSTPANGRIYNGNWNNDSLSLLLSGNTHYLGDINPFVTGKTVATATYHDRNMFGGGKAFWFTHYDDAGGVRFEFSLDPMSVATIPFNPSVSFLEPRRTVSAAETASSTAVALMASLDGCQSHFEWSNYGEWEQLPLPSGIEHMQSPELVIDNDGRWHIIYRDLETDDLMCMSTQGLPPI